MNKPGDVAAPEPPPSALALYETCLYYHGPEQAEDMSRFYGELLGLMPVNRGRWAFRIGGQLVLLFDERASRSQQSPPAHGAEAPTHLCFQVAPGTLSQWRARLRDHGVAIIDQVSWTPPHFRGAESIYFADPAGNPIELMEGDAWPDPNPMGLSG